MKALSYLKGLTINFSQGVRRFNLWKFYHENHLGQREVKRMTVEGLSGVDKIRGFQVIVMDELRGKYPDKFNESGGMDYKWFEKEIRPHNFIYVRQDVNSIAFTLQKGPKEEKVNGCGVDALIEAARIMLIEENGEVRCPEKSTAIMHLAAALRLLDESEIQGALNSIEVKKP